MKCEESKQPKNDQNSGDYPKHVFISLFLSARAPAFMFLPTAVMLIRARETIYGRDSRRKVGRRLSRCEHFHVLISHQSSTRSLAWRLMVHEVIKPRSVAAGAQNSAKIPDLKDSRGEGVKVAAFIRSIGWKVLAQLCRQRQVFTLAGRESDDSQPNQQ